MNREQRLPTATPPAAATAKRAAAGNPFLSGAFAPVAAETHAEQLTVRGEIPGELDGLYVRNGPNPLRPLPADKHHWFIGDGMVHGIRIAGGEARWYRNRYVGTHAVHKALGRPGIAGQPRGALDVVNTNVFAHAGSLWATVETGPVPIELDGELNSLRYGLFNSDRALGFTAHPHRDPLSGELHAICYDAQKHRELTYLCVDAQGRIAKLTPIPVRHGPMVHDCAITRTQVVVLDLPVTFSWWSMLKREPFPYAWNNRHAARVGLLPRAGAAADIRWYEVDPCYVFHTCNAYDLPDGSVVMDVVAHEHMFDSSRVGPEANTHPAFERWTLPAGGTRVQRARRCGREQEFPRLNEALTGQPYRYAYTVEFSVDQRTGQRVLKHDLETGETFTHQLGPAQRPSEFVFVARENAQVEDDGWLIGFAHNEASQRGEFHVLDARTLTPQAVVELPVRVPMGFHGNWVASGALR